MADENENQKLDLMEPTEEATEPDGVAYTAFEKWKYPQVIYKMEQDQPWIDFAESSLRGSKLLIDGVAKGQLNEDIEGIAGIQLFRHYLELMLKRVVFWGRMLEREDKNVVSAEAQQVAHIHDLGLLWEWVLKDAKPKLKTNDWDSYDIRCVERCLLEFDAADKKGFAFRYQGQGGEYYRYNYSGLAGVMDHIRQWL